MNKPNSEEEAPSISAQTPESREPVVARPEADADLYGREPSPQAAKPIGQWVRIATAVAVAIVLGLGALAAIEALARILVVAFLGITIAAALDPLVDRLERGRIPRSIIVITIYAILVGVLVIVGFLVVPGLIDQAEDLFARAPEYSDAVLAWVNRQTWLLSMFGVDEIEQIEPLDTISAGLTGVGSALLSIPGTVVTIIAEFGLMIFISIYWLILSSTMSKFVASLFPARQGASVLHVLRRVGSAMGGYLRGLLIDASILSIFSYVGLLLIGVNYALVLGVLTGLGEVIPVVGPFIAGVAIVLVSLFQSPQKALIALIFVLIMQQFENNLLVPIVMKSQVDISPLLTLVAVAVGGSIGGFLGAVVALPVAAALSALVRVAVAPAIRRRTGAPPVEEA